MALYTKSIFKEKTIADGLRISVMSRHTLNDGVTPDPRISEDSYNEWWKDLAPPAKLVGDFYKRGLPWDEYEKRYLRHLQKDKLIEWVKFLAARSLFQDITILCTEETPHYCHRGILANECKKYQPTLRIMHL